MSKSKSDVIHQVIRDRALTLLHQPIVSLDEGRVVGREVLTRGPAGPFESPQRLIRAAFVSSRLEDLEATICGLAAKTAISFLPPSELMFVNLTSTGFTKAGEVLRRALSPMPPSHVVVEVTEADRPAGDIAAAAAEWKAAGYGIAIDDVGAGFSRVLAIAQVRPEWIKIDRPLVAGSVDKDHWRAVVRHILELANEIGARVVAEGIETEAELKAMRSVGIEYGQGYLIARPAVMRALEDEKGGVSVALAR
ncbi:MAG: EAL domain-containing protein [Bacillota bacterium]